MRGMLMTMVLVEQKRMMARMRWQGGAWESLKWRKVGDNKTCLDRPLLIMKHVWGPPTTPRADHLAKLLDSTSSWWWVHMGRTRMRKAKSHRQREWLNWGGVSSLHPRSLWTHSYLKRITLWMTVFLFFQMLKMMTLSMAKKEAGRPQRSQCQ